MSKICFTPLLMCPQGCQGCQKIQTTKLKSALVICSIRFRQNWRNCRNFFSKLNKNCQKNLVYEGFLNFIQFWLNLSAPAYHRGLQFGLLDFWHPWHPWGHVNSGDILVLRFAFDTFCTAAPSGNFFILFKLKPDITCIDLTSIKSENITF